MEDSVFSYLGDLTVGEGEEHVAKALTQEAAGLGVGQGTDDRVPGRLLGRQAEYEKIGADPYIFRSEFLVSFALHPCRAILFKFHLVFSSASIFF